jgi:glycerol kinase
MTGGEYVGVIDQGTSGVRFMVFDHGGTAVAHAYREHDQLYPRPDWVEYDPVDIWETTKAVIQDAFDGSTVTPAALATIGIANQRETSVVWVAETATPVYNAISWQDRRTTDRIEQLEAAGRTDRIRELTGLHPHSYFSAAKVEWILDNADSAGVPGAAGRDVRELAADGELLLGTLDSWLIYNLTGAHVTDVTNASQTMLFDIRDLAWSDELLAEFDVPPGMLPEVRPSSDESHYGHTDPDGFLGTAVPVSAALGDQQAALFGQACFDDGDLKNTYGTGSFLLMNTGTEPIESDNGLLTTVAFQRSGEPVTYALEGPIFSVGAAIEWLDDVSLVDHPSETADIAAEVDSTDGVYVVPAFTGLGAPYWGEPAQGTVFGLTRGTSRAHVVRATLEAIAFRTRDVVEAMAADAGVGIDELRVDGGAARNNFFCQLQADLVGADVVRPDVDETTALGAAYAAGLAVGYWESVEELRDHWTVESRFMPELDRAAADASYSDWTDAVDRTLGWAGDRG